MVGKGPKPIAKAPTKEEKERLSREKDKIKFVNVRFENRQIVQLDNDIPESDDIAKDRS